MTKQKKKILQIGQEDWSNKITLSDKCEWIHVEPQNIPLITIEKTVDVDGSKTQNKPECVPEVYDVLLLTDKQIVGDLNYIEATINAYTVICQPDATYYSELETFFKKKMIQTIDMTNPQEVVSIIEKNFFNTQYGSKFTISTLEIDPNFDGQIRYEGSAYLSLNGEFGEEFRPLGNWQYNVMITANLPQEIWLEYVLASSCEIELRVYLIESGSDHIIKEWQLTQADMQKAFIFDESVDGYLSFTLWGKGHGEIKIGSLHYRFSNHQYGKFILGGECYADSSRQEFIYYFNPGNLKPPLNIYFSGYRPAEGFEGYWMMKQLGHPFILFGDPRLEGGSFYIGSNEYEQKIKSIIKEAMNYLGFSNQQLIFSGLSMGTYGALYYGCQYSPHSIIVGKPLSSIGTIAEISQKVRPNEFMTIFDVLKLHAGSTSSRAIQQLNQRFWDVFSNENFKDTNIAVSYMKHDDYDPNAYYDLIANIPDDSIKLYGHGWIGRHNDNSSAIINWFYTQYKTIINQEFGGDLSL